MSKIKIDPDDLTLDEIDEVEETIGGPIDAIFTSGKPKAKVLKAIVLVITKRTDPDATMETIGSVKLSDLELGE